MEVSESCHFYLYQNIFLFLFRGFFIWIVLANVLEALLIEQFGLVCDR